MHCVVGDEFNLRRSAGRIIGGSFENRTWFLFQCYCAPPSVSTVYERYGSVQTVSFFTQSVLSLILVRTVWFNGISCFACAERLSYAYFTCFVLVRLRFRLLARCPREVFHSPEKLFAHASPVVVELVMYRRSTHGVFIQSSSSMQRLLSASDALCIRFFTLFWCFQPRISW